MIYQRCVGLLHRLVSSGKGYDLCRFVTGEWFTRSKWLEFFRPCSGLVLDLGGGTGYIGDLLPPGCVYVCLDNEMPKLQWHRARQDGTGLLADARRIPLKDFTVDFLTCLAVTHHLKDGELEEVFREVDRVMKPGGQFLLADAVRKPARLPSRILWALDRGAYPRPREVLTRLVEQHFRIVRSDRFAFYHEYILFTCVRKSPAVR